MNKIAENIIYNMSLYEAVATQTLNSPEFKLWFRNSKVVDSHGNPLPVYHGTGRPDRIGNQFRKSRATAGPMAYFTENPTIASNYAETKPDTSLKDIDNYADMFIVKIGKIKMNISKAWYLLPAEERERIKKLAPSVFLDDDANIVIDHSHEDGLGGYDYTSKRHRGNVLATLVEMWLEGGTLYGNEKDFLEVLKLSGLTQPVILDDHSETKPFVYQVYLSIQNPLITDNIPQNVLAALAKSAKRQTKSTGESSGILQWNKNHQDAEYWINNLNQYSWTVIPDWVTKVLKTFGYDGIKDIGFRSNPDPHTVWIPFEEYQVKSAISNSSFDSMNNNITK